MAGDVVVDLVGRFGPDDVLDGERLLSQVDVAVGPKPDAVAFLRPNCLGKHELSSDGV